MPVDVRPKAVVFTHINPKLEDLKTLDAERQYVDDLTKTFLAYLRCSNIGLVYIYVSRGVEKLVEHMGKQEKSTPQEPLDCLGLMDEVGRCNGLIEAALDNAKRSVRPDPCQEAQFVIIDVAKLAPLLSILRSIKPTLITKLAGWRTQKPGNKEPQFSYDSPKFFEALIRIVRGVDVLLAADPVVRTDRDVVVNSDAIQGILDEYRKAIDRHDRFFLFSGGYIGPKGADDDLNSHAVRTTWFFDSLGRRANSYHLSVSSRRFLEHLEVLGARQIPSEGGSAQVISGAGLVMSLRAILVLPPFMNAGCGIVWIDDHLKRKLHEAIGDLAAGEPERLDQVLFVQDRHGDRGVTESDHMFIEETYFPRLLRGCMMDAVVGRGGAPGPLADCLKGAADSGRTRLSRQRRKSVKRDITSVARERGVKAVEKWENEDYGNDILAKWAERLKEQKNAVSLDAIVNSTVTAAMNYIDLFVDWQFYVDAFLRLKRTDVPWLFKDVR